MKRIAPRGADTKCVPPAESVRPDARDVAVPSRQRADVPPKPLRWRGQGLAGACVAPARRILRLQPSGFLISAFSPEKLAASSRRPPGDRRPQFIRFATSFRRRPRRPVLDLVDGDDRHSGRLMPGVDVTPPSAEARKVMVDPSLFAAGLACAPPRQARIRGDLPDALECVSDHRPSSPLVWSPFLGSARAGTPSPRRRSRVSIGHRRPPSIAVIRLQRHLFLAGVRFLAPYHERGDVNSSTSELRDPRFASPCSRDLRLRPRP